MDYCAWVPVVCRHVTLNLQFLLFLLPSLLNPIFETSSPAYCCMSGIYHIWFGVFGLFLGQQLTGVSGAELLWSTSRYWLGHRIFLNPYITK